MARPASKPREMSAVFSAFTTGLPRPSAPTSAAITTIDRESMMHWVMPAAMLGIACGSSMRVSSCQREQPKALPASSSSAGTSWIPRQVRRIGAATAKITVEIRPGTTPRPNRVRVGIR